MFEGDTPLPSGSSTFGEGGFKLSDLLHTLGGFLGILFIKKKISRKIYIYRIYVSLKCVCAWGGGGVGIGNDRRGSGATG